MTDWNVFDRAYINMSSSRNLHGKWVEILSRRRGHGDMPVIISFIDEIIDGDKAMCVDSRYLVKGKGQLDDNS